jgi:flavin-binding protein dodecin
MEAPRTTEVIITATSPLSFEDAINEGIARATRTLRGVQEVQVRDQKVLTEAHGDNIVGYQVQLVVVSVAESVLSSEDVGVVLDPDEYRRLSEAEEELEDLRAYDEAIMELRSGEDELVPWEIAKAEIEEERAERRRRGEL